MPPDRQLNFKTLLVLWSPLAIMWIVMAVEQPAITAAIARLDEAKIQLAAFGFTFALALFIEGPVIQMLAAGTAISDTKDSYKKILKVMHVLGVGCTGVHLFFSIPSVFRFIAEDLIQIPRELVAPSWQSFFVMTPWAIAVGYRRLWQGVMIKYGRSAAVPITMYIRLGVSGLVLIIGLVVKTIPGALLGGLSLSLGVIAGAVASGLYTLPIVRNRMPEKREGVTEYSTREIGRFYFPLGLTSLITLGSRPILNFGIARGLLPLESLAVWPVILGYLFVYTAISLSLQEIVIAQLKGLKSMASLKQFVNRIAFGVLAVYCIVLITPLRELWFSKVAGLPEDLLFLVPFTVMLLSVTPFIQCYTSLYRGILVSLRRTTVVTIGVGINVGLLLLLTFAAAAFIPTSGVYLAAGAFTLAYGVECIYLAVRVKQINPFAVLSHG